MEGGGASTEKIGCLPDPFVSRQYVTKCIDFREETKPADKAEVPTCLFYVWMNVVFSSCENCEDVSCAFHIMVCVHGLCKALDKKVEGVVCTYLTVCITKCLGLLVGSVQINRIVVISIGEFRLCGLVFLMIRGIMARTARRLGCCCITWFALEGHDIIGIDGLGRQPRSMRRSTCGRRNFGDKGVECSCRNMVLCHQGSCCDHGFIIIRVIEPGNLRHVQEGAIRAYSTTIRCYGKSRILKMKATLCTFYTLFNCPKTTNHPTVLEIIYTEL